MQPQTAASVPAGTLAYHWRNVVIRGGGFVSGVVYSWQQKGLVYARTDVGGIYRSTNAGEQWTAVTDQLGPKERNLTGIDSLALDPSDANNVYAAAGRYSADWAPNGAILISRDQGRTWTKVEVPFKMGGNEDGRNTGERLAVDPRHGSTLLCGTRKAGLWKSMDSGRTWARVESFPIGGAVDRPGKAAGLTFVLFGNKSGAGPVPIYVGVAKAGASLYRSLDDGARWQLVPQLPGSVGDLFASRAEISATGVLYVNFVNAPGPNGITDGAVVRIDPDGKARDISPLVPGVGDAGRFGYGGLSVDAEDADTLMVTTIDRWSPDKIFRSTDGGKHWKDSTLR